MNGYTNRREFLKKATVLSACAVVEAGGAYALSADPVNLGVIGTGGRGKGLIRRLMEGIGGLKVVAVADPIPFRLQEGIDAAGGVPGYLDYEELLADSRIDAVIIATPFSTHDELSIAALDAGKHVYCEKTMAKGMQEIQAVIDKVKSSELVFQTGHQYHSSPLYAAARDIIRAGYIGDITAYHSQWNRNGDWRRPVPDHRYERQINWRMYREYSGGLVAELLSHQIDFVNWVTDSHPAKIVGFGGIDYWRDGRETFDNVHLLMEYPNGLDAQYMATTSNAYDDYKLKVMGSKGTIILDYHKGEIFLEDMTAKKTGVVDGVSGATLKAWQTGVGAPIDAEGGQPSVSALRQFYQSIVHGAPVVSDVRTGAIASKCVQMSLDALYSGEIVYWRDYPELDFA